MIQTHSSPAVRQNADLTFKLNRQYGRHGWLRLTPAYSVKLVSEILATSDRGIRVLDPFSGTSTTPLCAASAGYTATGVEINPFLIWFGNVKLATYSPLCIRATGEALADLITQASGNGYGAVRPPAIHNIERWWHPAELDFLRKFKAALDKTIPYDCPMRDLILVVFCRLIIRFSNAVFNHQSISFKDKVKGNKAIEQQLTLFEMSPALADIAYGEGEVVLNSAADNPSGRDSVLSGDSRAVSMIVTDKYVAKYFEDMWHHIHDVATVIRQKGTVHYVIGNSRFYDTVVPVERLFADMLTEAGLRETQITRIRKRNSKQELYEFDVSARR